MYLQRFGRYFTWKRKWDFSVFCLQSKAEKSSRHKQWRPVFTNSYRSKQWPKHKPLIKVIQKSLWNSNGNKMYFMRVRTFLKIMTMNKNVYTFCIVLQIVFGLSVCPQTLDTHIVQCSYFARLFHGPSAFGRLQHWPPYDPFSVT